MRRCKNLDSLIRQCRRYKIQHPDAVIHINNWQNISIDGMELSDSERMDEIIQGIQKLADELMAIFILEADDMVGESIIYYESYLDKEGLPKNRFNKVQVGCFSTYIYPRPLLLYF